jgi:predicted component of type VI protein secretion system
MSNNRVEIGATERKNDASEGITEIDGNRTLFVQQMTDEPDGKMQVVDEVTNVKEALETFKPEVKVYFADEEGTEAEELLRFLKMGDFGPNGLSENSDFLKSLAGDLESLHKIMKNLKSNKVFQRLLADQEAKSAYMEMLEELMNDLADD